MKNKNEMNINHLINSVNFYFTLDISKSKEYWVELKSRLEKISWNEELIKMYNKPFYDKYISSGLLSKKFEFKNGVPISWEGEI